MAQDFSEKLEEKLGLDDYLMWEAKEKFIELLERYERIEEALFHSKDYYLKLKEKLGAECNIVRSAKDRYLKLVQFSPYEAKKGLFTSLGDST